MAPFTACALMPLSILGCMISAPAMVGMPRPCRQQQHVQNQQGCERDKDKTANSPLAVGSQVGFEAWSR